MTGMKRFQFDSLQTRLLLLLLLPVFLILMAAGWISFWYARTAMVSQLNDLAILKLQRAAHLLEMQVLRPLEQLNTLHQAAVQANISVSPERIIPVLEQNEGVVSVTWQGRSLPHASGRGMAGHRPRITQISSPEYTPDENRETVSLTVSFSGDLGVEVGIMTIRMEFEALLQEIRDLGWWYTDMACIVDASGAYLTHSGNRALSHRRYLGGTGDPLEEAIRQKMQIQSSGTVQSTGHPPDVVAGFYRLSQIPWTIILFADGHRVLKPIVAYRNGFAVGSGAVVLVVLVLIRFHVCRVVTQIRDLSRRAREVALGRYGSPIPVVSRDEIGELVAGFNAMVRGLEERDFIRNCFGRYVDPEFARTLMAHPEAVALGGTRRHAVMLMSDIRGFTHLSETLTPEQTIRVLNRYFSRMIAVIQQHQGIIVDFYGDAILVFFDPLSEPLSATIRRSLSCAVRMQGCMDAVNRDLTSEGLPALSMGIGIHTGPVVVGNIGSTTRSKYGVVGSAVNITARIQAHAGSGQVVISHSVCDHIGEDPVPVHTRFQARLKGLDAAISLYVLDSQAYETTCIARETGEGESHDPAV